MMFCRVCIRVKIFDYILFYVFDLYFVFLFKDLFIVFCLNYMIFILILFVNLFLIFKLKKINKCIYIWVGYGEVNMDINYFY